MQLQKLRSLAEVEAKQHYITSNGSRIAGPFPSEREAEAALDKLLRKAKPEDEMDDAKIVLEARESFEVGEARSLFDNMEGSIMSVDKWANGQLLAKLLEKHKHPATESKAFRAAVKKMYAEFEDLKMSVMAPLQQMSEAVEPAPAKEFTERQLTKLLNDAEDQLEHEARYKSFDLDMATKTLEWVTQETYETSQKRAAARGLAKILKTAGATGWTVKVTVRDDYRGDKTKWVTAKS